MVTLAAHLFFDLNLTGIGIRCPLQEIFGKSVRYAPDELAVTYMSLNCSFAPTGPFWGTHSHRSLAKCPYRHPIAGLLLGQSGRELRVSTTPTRSACGARPDDPSPAPPLPSAPCSWSRSGSTRAQTAARPSQRSASVGGNDPQTDHKRPVLSIENQKVMSEALS